MKKTLLILCLVIGSNSTYALSLMGRMGVGMSDHLVTNMKTLSLKLQNSRVSAIGGTFGIDNSEDGSFYALGLKYYQLIYEEPQLNFYSAAGVNIFTYEDVEQNATKSGYQLDGVFGTEFSFQGLESIGFSFEFGISLYNIYEKTHIATTGQNFIKSAVHFYL